MASGWAYFRKHWIKPEVYPLIGSMAAALGVCGAAMINKVRDPTVGWNKSKRKNNLYEDVEEVVPMWSNAKKNSTRIFGSSRDIVDSQKVNIVSPDPITVKIGHAEEEEQEEEQEKEQEEVVEEHKSEEENTPVDDDPVAVQPQPTETVVADSVHPEEVPVDVMNEAEETINAAIEAAMKASEVASQSDSSEQTASSIAENPPPAQSVEPTAAQG